MAPAMERDTEVSAQRMEPVTVPPHRGRSILLIPGRVVFSTLLFFLCGLGLLLPASPSPAEEKGMILAGSGIRYPEGFDQNTVGEVRGKAYRYGESESGPVRFELDAEKETYTVLASPVWYQKDLGRKLSDGTEVRVRGSKTLGKDGNLYIIAQEITILPNGETLAFRSEDGTPLWKGPRMEPRGLQGGFGSPSRGMGGMGSGPGGSGRGRK